MRRFVSVTLLSVCFLFLLTACKAPQGGGGNSYSMFYSPADHVSELMVKGAYTEASTIYGNERTWFQAQGDDPDVQALLTNLASHLKGVYEPELRRTMAEVQKLTWPASSDTWSGIKAALAALERQVVSAESVPLFKNPEYGYPLIQNARQQLETKRTEIAQYAPTAFTLYPINADKNFFAEYPVNLQDQDFLQKQKTLWAKKVQCATSKELLHMHKTYGDVLPADMQKELAQTYFRKLCPNVEKADFAAITTAYDAVLDAGMQLDAIPGIKIAFIDVTSETLKKRGVIEFPVGVEMDMPIKALNEDLKKGFESKAVKSADIIILFNLAATRTSRKVDTSTHVKSTYLAGYTKVNNPEWDILQVELQQSNMEIMTNSNTQLPTSTGNPYMDLGNALANWESETKVDEAKERIEELKKKVRTTPRFIDEPVYDPYRFQRVEMDVLKTGSIQYYIIDKRKKTYYSDFFDVTSKEFFTVAYQLQETDPNLEEYMSTNVTEKMVDQFEKEAISVKLSELLSNYSDNKAKTRRYRSLASIRKDVVKNRNVALASMKEKEYGFDKHADKRFESVLIVQNSSSLGTGFYVTDDIVLTNYHVVEEQKFIELKKWGDLETFGKVIAKDVRLDLALIKVQDRGIPVVFYDKKNVKIGETVEAIGHPHGMSFTLSRGVISTVRTSPGISGVAGNPILFIQTDAPINPGNSGGPLFLGNRVIGVNDYCVTKDISEGLNFSIHYSEVFKFLNENHIKYQKG
ncbi:trypsin-like serine protease [Pseudodesulfovibrio sp. JC047]|uniref:S1C family serine protease n=1 Tax=Pseudodesulfovibrio sp. JC047 TaxID=2683199 RepID=UPI0013D6884C|nr:trypsin-like peptidase domain-containing protein [Pseudodesulfovibrio sp. JC047]NDV19814.1 trypsin-like serine protease [Pseudodesulfovibrio sp. JC047]